MLESSISSTAGLNLSSPPTMLRRDCGWQKRYIGSFKEKLVIGVKELDEIELGQRVAEARKRKRRSCSFGRVEVGVSFTVS
jgi:hypothetical protein